MSLVNYMYFNKDSRQVKPDEWKAAHGFDDEKLEKLEKYDGYYSIMSN